MPPGTFAFQPVWSPDGTQIAYGYLAADDEAGLRSANIWRINADGSAPRVVTQPPASFTGSYRDPAWAPGGHAVWVTVVTPKKDMQSGVIRMHSEIRRVAVADGAETPVIADGHAPALAPDGTQIAYLQRDPETARESIWLNRVAGDHPRLLVPADTFAAIYAPLRFSPDGRVLAFAAADALDQPTGQSNGAEKSHFPAMLRNFFQPAPLNAHGLYPADVWLADVETGQLTRLTQLAEDHPAPVWSSSGRYLAFMGRLGIYFVDVTTHVAIRITDQGVDGQLDWRD
jgi:Tol biopolymer transport system component